MFSVGSHCNLILVMYKEATKASASVYVVPCSESMLTWQYAASVKATGHMHSPMYTTRNIGIARYILYKLFVGHEV